MYLQIEGVKGEPNDDKHKDWIELVGVDWGVAQPASLGVSSSGGHTVGRAEFTPLIISKTVDLGSPELMELTAQGKTIPKAKIEFIRADGSGPIKYYEIELENVLVSSNKKTYGGAGLLHESFTLHYSKITEKYTQQKIGGGTGGNTSGSWNLATNKAT